MSDDKERIEALLKYVAALEKVLNSSPVLSKYHGEHGFEYNRFMTDYYAWVEQKRLALADALP